MKFNVFEYSRYIAGKGYVFAGLTSDGDKPFPMLK